MEHFGNATIGALAEAAGVNVETVRFYQRKGLVPEPRRPAGAVRRYGEAELSRLRFIKASQRLGFSLAEVAELLMLEDGAQCNRARRLAERKLADVRAKLSDLRRMEAAIGALVRRCRSSRGAVRCPMISALRSR